MSTTTTPESEWAHRPSSDCDWLSPNSAPPAVLTEEEFAAAKARLLGMRRYPFVGQRGPGTEGSGRAPGPNAVAARADDDLLHRSGTSLDVPRRGEVLLCDWPEPILSTGGCRRVGMMGQATRRPGRGDRRDGAVRT